MHCMIPVAFGMESLVSFELKEHGIDDVFIEDGACFFDADEALMMRLNASLRIAERIYKQYAMTSVTTFDQLFDTVSNIAWETVLQTHGQFIVHAQSKKSTLFSLRDIQKITKKAIITRLQKHTSAATFEETGPAHTILISLNDNLCGVYLDTTGDALHKRGYRLKAGTAPLKETLAAALISLSVYRKDRTLIDPFCGSGTIVIEAALKARNIAPGKQRTFAYEAFVGYDAALKKRVMQALVDAEYKGAIAPLMASDYDEQALEAARQNAMQAGVLDDISFSNERFEMKKFPAGHHLVITNPPYGERLRPSDSETLYKAIGRAMQRTPEYSWYIYTSTLGAEKFLGRKAPRTRVLFNGPIKARYYQYLGPKPPQK